MKIIKTRISSRLDRTARRLGGGVWVWQKAPTDNRARTDKRTDTHTHTHTRQNLYILATRAVTSASVTNWGMSPHGIAGPQNQSSPNSGKKCPLARALTMQTFVAIRQEVFEISAIKKLCSPKKWAAQTSSILSPAWPTYSKRYALHAATTRFIERLYFGIEVACNSKYPAQHWRHCKHANIGANNTCICDLVQQLQATRQAAMCTHTTGQASWVSPLL